MKKLIALSIATLSIFNTTSAFASTNNETTPIIYKDSQKINLSDDTILELKTFLSESNVEEDIQDSLIKKIERGEKLDCFNDDYLSQIPQNFFNISINEPVKRYTFPDGSFIEKGIIIPKDLKEISGGSGSSGTGFSSVKGAKVYIKQTVYSLGFFADYTFVQGGDDYISKVYDGYGKVIGGSMELPELSIKQKSENVSGPAEAEIKTQINYVANTGYSETAWLKLHVGYDSAWTSNN